MFNVSNAAALLSEEGVDKTKKHDLEKSFKKAFKELLTVATALKTVR